MLDKMTILRMLEESGGMSNEYPFIEMGLLGILDEMLAEGLVVRRPHNQSNFAEIRITDAGRNSLWSGRGSSDGPIMVTK